ncbi:IS66 family transposase [Lacrimispora brassicae]
MLVSFKRITGIKKDDLRSLCRVIITKAITYAKNHQKTLCNYLLDGRCELSNNAAERRAKSYAIGRKNFLFITRYQEQMPVPLYTA